MPSTGRMLWRGMRRRCPRCGERRIFASWFRMVEACPGCGLRFERENDFFLGAYVINLAVTEGLLLIGLFVFIAVAVGGDADVPLVPVLVVAALVAVGGPLLFFPFSRTIWAAVDLAMRPVPIEERTSSD